jgi:hypothetical protein
LRAYVERGSTAWEPALYGERAAVAVNVARAIAQRSFDPFWLRQAIEAASRQTSYPHTVRWESCGIAQGDVGLALLAGYLDACFAEENWDRVAHRLLSSAVGGAQDGDGLPPGLFSGDAGLAFVAWLLSRDGARYQRLLRGLDKLLVSRCHRTAEDIRAREKPGLPVSAFDVITGLSGTGMYLLCRRNGSEVKAALDDVLAALVFVSQETDTLPRWYTPTAYMGDKSMARLYPHGCLNCGLAHGIPGPLALMALALRAGLRVDGLRAAVVRIADWLAGSRMEDAWGVNWPTAVPVMAGGQPGLPDHTSRAAWCYGSPGVARALWLAGEALDDVALRELAIEAMAAIYRRPIAERQVDSPTFCHGVAGLLQVTLRFRNDTGLRVFAEAAEALADQLLAAYDSERPLGYASLEPDGRAVDQPGLLDGAPGVALVLLAAATAAPPSWDRVFLLS